MAEKSRLVLLHGPETAARIEAIDRIAQLVAQGKSRLTAERMVELENGATELRRARRHPTSRS